MKKIKELEPLQEFRTVSGQLGRKGYQRVEPCYVLGWLYSRKKQVWYEACFEEDEYVFVEKEDHEQ